MRRIILRAVTGLGYRDQPYNGHPDLFDGAVGRGRDLGAQLAHAAADRAFCLGIDRRFLLDLQRRHAPRIRPRSQCSVFDSAVFYDGAVLELFE